MSDRDGLVCRCCIKCKAVIWIKEEKNNPWTKFKCERCKANLSDTKDERV